MMRPIAAGAAVVGVGAGVAAFLLNQSIRYTCPEEHIYTHDTVQG
jgi:hypothetical protein